MRIHAHAGAAGRVPGGDAAGRGDELDRVFGVQAHLDGVAAQFDLALREGQLLAGGHADLHLHDVDAAGHLGDGVLHLYARVHLDEVELAVLEQELEGARATVADLLAGGGAALAHFLDQAAGDAGGRRFFDDLLVAALHGAVAFAQPHGVLVLVGQHLDLDVARVLQELFHVDRRVAEGGTRLGARGLHGMDQRGLGVHDAHAASATAASGLDDHRVADGAGRADDLLRVFGQSAFGAGHAGHAGLDHGLFGRDLVTHDADGLGRGADEGEAAGFDALGEVGVLGQEAVAGVDGLGVGHLGGRDDGRHVQVALRRGGWADADGLVGQAHVLGVAVGLGIDDDGLDAHLAAGTLNT